MTPWLQIMGKTAPQIPLVIVNIRRSGEEIIGLTATVRAALGGDANTHGRSGNHLRHYYCNDNNNNKRPLTPKSMPPAGDEHAKLKT